MAVKIKPDATVKLIVASTFPEYKGRKFSINVSDRSFPPCAFWDGGSRSQYKVFALANLKSYDPPASISNPFTAGAHGEIAPVPGVLIVEHAIFCGKDAGITIHVHPSDAAPLLPAVKEA